MPQDCVLLGSYLELDCLTDKQPHNKVVAVGVIKNPTKDFSLPATYDYTDKEELAEDIEVISKVIGEYDGGEAEVTEEAFGTKLNEISSRTHTLDFEVEYNAKNRDFFNGLGSSKNYGIVFLSGNLEELEYSGKVNVLLNAKTPITRELKKGRRYMVTATWSNLDLAIPVAVPQTVKALFD